MGGGRNKAKMSNQVVKNSLFNILSRGWSIISLYIFVPLWIKYVGVEGYGVITFYSVLMTLMHFADAGLSGTLMREFARVEPKEGYKRDFLRTFETIYLGIAFFVFLVVFLFSGFFVDHFMKSATIPREELLECVKIMAVIMGLNFMTTLYNGGLMGLQKQILAGSLNIGYSICRGVVVLIPLTISPTIQTFLWWQLVSMVILFIAERYFLLKFVNKNNSKSRFQIGYFKNVWRYTLGLMLMAIVAALNTQFDKLVTGNVLSLESMGYYSIAGTLGTAVVTIATSICGAFYPELTRLVSIGNKEQIIKPFLFFSFLVSLVTSSIGISVFFYCSDVLYIWTRDANIVAHATVPAMILILGNIAISLQYSNYYLAMANGHTRTSVVLSSCMLLIMAPSIYFLTKNYGLNATPIPYFVLNLVVAIIMAIVLIKKFLEGTLIKWINNSLLPIIVALIVVAPTSYLVKSFISNPYIRIGIACIVGTMCMYLTTIAYIRNNPECKTSNVISKFLKFVPAKWR